MSRRTAAGLFLAAMFLSAEIAVAQCGAVRRLSTQGLSVGEIAGHTGLSLEEVADCQSGGGGRDRRVAPRRVPRFGAAGEPPVGAAGPPPVGAAGPPPFGAAGPPPLNAGGFPNPPD